MPKTAITALISGVDRNRDGVLDFDEFVDFMRVKREFDRAASNTPPGSLGTSVMPVIARMLILTSILTLVLILATLPPEAWGPR